MKVIVTAKWLIKPGKEQAWIDLVRSLLKPSSSESGCISYTMYKGIYEPNTHPHVNTAQSSIAPTVTTTAQNTVIEELVVMR
jgi:Antibiotic biosynthesis monooxygenase